jgi:hypothetical protein
MHSPFINGKKSVLKEWKNLRQLLSNGTSDLWQMETVMKFWNLAPISAKILDWDSPDSWPDAWQMINDNEYDDCMAALGMFYTMMLADDRRWDGNRLELMLAWDRRCCIQRLVLLVDRRWLMNFEYDRIIDVSVEHGSECMIQQRYQYDGKKHRFRDDISWQDLPIPSDNRQETALNNGSS